MNSHKLDESDIKRLSVIVSEMTGNQVLEKNHSMLESRLRARMIKLGVSSTSDYWRYFEQNENLERNVLQGLMTTHYTFFFREYLHFEVLEDWLNRHSKILIERFKKTQAPLRVWSAACSRGHEVYSLAMFLENNLLKKYGVEFEVIGSDIDSESVAYAKNGVYPIKEVNVIPHHYLNEFWKRGTGSVKEFAAIHPNLKSKVSFFKGNLLDSETFPKETFDVIFARNVFIYFSEENVRKIALSLRSKLLADGLLISGVSEPLRFEGWNMNSVAPSSYCNSKEFTNDVVYAAPTLQAVSVVHQPVPQKQVESAKYKVLCVDDSSTIQLLIKKIFASDALCESVTVANNGQEAVDALAAGHFDLITLDIHMPVMGGIEFLEKAYRPEIHPPVIMVSSVNRTDLDLATKSLTLGAFDYVEKPAMNNLQKSIDEILTKARLALKQKNIPTSQIQNNQFEQSIGQKIVVPDASICLRWIELGSAPMPNIESALMALDGELRSPPLVICVDDTRVEAADTLMRRLSSREVRILSKATAFLKPNMIFICPASLSKELTTELKSKSVSLQLLGETKSDLAQFAKFPTLQVLLDEGTSQATSSQVRSSGLRVSDITPATSFVSLSVEFFANLRKAA
jgi:chemotaxis protein methyltransferase CheR